MGKYTDFEQQMNNVLTYHDRELANIKRVDLSQGEKQIKASEELLKSLGYQLPTTWKRIPNPQTKKIMVVPTWEELCAEAEEVVGGKCDIEELFTEEELQANSQSIIKMNREFKQIHQLDKFDYMISACAGLLGALTDILLVGIPYKTYEGLKAGPLSDYIRDYFNRKFPEEEMEKLANQKISKVPYDAQDNRNTKKKVEGLSSYYHRLLSVGHDPYLGFIVGVADIMKGTMTTIDKGGNIRSQVMKNYVGRKESDVFAAIAKQILHLKTDITTSMGLPVPMMSLFNFLQIGKIGEYDQTISEIVQGMYYEGFDFIHFCSQSFPVMVTEVVVRLAYFIKRRKEGFGVRESIPFSVNHEKHPKLATMLFIGHSGVAAINAGKVIFTENPMAINYPQWMAFAKYAYQQLKWVLMNKPALRDKYVSGRITEEMNTIISSVNETFNDFSNEYIVVFE